MHTSNRCPSQFPESRVMAVKNFGCTAHVLLSTSENLTLWMRMGILGYPRISRGIPGYQVNISPHLQVGNVGLSLVRAAFPQTTYWVFAAQRLITYALTVTISVHAACCYNSQTHSLGPGPGVRCPSDSVSESLNQQLQPYSILQTPNSHLKNT